MVRNDSFNGLVGKPKFELFAGKRKKYLVFLLGMGCIIPLYFITMGIVEYRETRNLTEKIAAEFSCGTGDVDYFCDSYGLTSKQLYTSLVLKRSFGKYLTMDIWQLEKPKVGMKK